MLMIISGGQTGVDRAALDAALKYGAPCGGWCPEARLAEDGPISARYPLREIPGGGYRERTLRNILDSDGTVILCFGTPQGGTRQTLDFCQENRKPCLLIDGNEIRSDRAVEFILAFIEESGIAVLNVAGPRASEEPLGRAYAFEIIGDLIRKLQ